MCDVSMPSQQAYYFPLCGSWSYTTRVNNNVTNSVWVWGCLHYSKSLFPCLLHASSMGEDSHSAALGKVLKYDIMNPTMMCIFKTILQVNFTSQIEIFKKSTGAIVSLIS